MSKQPDPVADYQAAVEAFVQNAAKDYACLPVGDFQAHKRAIELAEKQRDDAGKKAEAARDRRIATMPWSEFQRRTSENRWDDL